MHSWWIDEKEYDISSGYEFIRFKLKEQEDASLLYLWSGMVVLMRFSDLWGQWGSVKHTGATLAYATLCSATANSSGGRVNLCDLGISCFLKTSPKCFSRAIWAEHFFGSFLILILLWSLDSLDFPSLPVQFLQNISSLEECAFHSCF